MNFRLMALNVKQFCPQLSIPVIKQRINIRYQQVIGSEDWEFLNDSTTVKLVGITSNTSTESCTVVEDSTTVTGVGTSWTSAMDGYLFRVGTDAQPYVISSVDSTTTITLETAYGDPDASSQDFTYWPRFYSPSVGDVGEITSVVYEQPLKEVSKVFLNQLDAERESTGPPVYWSVYSKSSATGIVTFEVWPVPDEDYVVTVFYKKTVSDLSTDTDEPVFRPEVLEAGVLWDCYRLAYGVTQNPAYIGMARDAQKEFQLLSRQMLIEDLSTASLPRKVRDVGGSLWFDDNFLLDHDVEVL
ncbi:MAG: hypothetical protein KKF27_21725 [Gammaproteobacteria bacterium]|nr:hypothetical protein [Gammaproteobacteria bacterium]MBU2685870.1 hypothetical protein [Gammaproteobacteria bacterium]